MKLRNLLLMAAITASTSSFAAEYYVVPGNTATGNDGSSWEKAITIWDIYANEATAKKVEDNSKYKNGDVFYFASGVYYPTLTAGGVPQR
ncbi:MAG: T9SS C-terminal target domain-containing protein, partial [Prevotella sp.]|nr:T9SS C-terminal target domain-containing protein [Prevotella sp.]